MEPETHGEGTEVLGGLGDLLGVEADDDAACRSIRVWHQNAVQEFTRRDEAVEGEMEGELERGREKGREGHCLLAEKACCDPC